MKTKEAIVKILENHKMPMTISQIHKQVSKRLSVRAKTVRNRLGELKRECVETKIVTRNGAKMTGYYIKEN